MADVYATVTAQIVEAIERGAGSWRMPWHTNGLCSSSPINVASKKAYRGINILCLWATAQSKGYASGLWGTYKQWQDKGAQVRKGEKSTAVVFWKFADKSEGEEGETNRSGSRLLFCSHYAVFNAAQVDGYTEPAAIVNTLERIEAAEAFFGALGSAVTHGGNSAFYRPSEDTITMPLLSAFDDSIAYYSTLAHEHTHWTAPEHRCNRQELGKRFGDNAYAAEELIAELGAAFMCAHLGLSTVPRPDHAQYLQSWLKVLKADSKAIFTAASKAQQAADWMIAKSGAVAVAA